MERLTKQQISVGQTEHQSCVMEQPGQPINKQTATLQSLKRNTGAFARPKHYGCTLES